MDLMLAIEMSRLQATEDRLSSRQTYPMTEIRITSDVQDMATQRRTVNSRTSLETQSSLESSNSNSLNHNGINNNVLSFGADNDYEEDDSGNSELDSQFESMLADLSRPSSHRKDPSRAGSPSRETIAQKAVSFFLKNSFSETVASKNKNLDKNSGLPVNKTDKDLFSFTSGQSQGFVN
jgi:hypothetical protein